MTALVIADHDNATLGAATLNTVTAASQINSDVHILVAGSGCAAVAEQAAKVAGVAKVILVDDGLYANALAENLSGLIVDLAAGYDAIVAPATTMVRMFCPVSRPCSMWRRFPRLPKSSQPTLLSGRFMPGMPWRRFRPVMAKKL